MYPLRALANDHDEGLLRRLAPLGIRIHRANGAIDAGERAALMQALESGEWDIICATPEFVQFHLVLRLSLLLRSEHHLRRDALHGNQPRRLWRSQQSQR